MLRVLVVDDHPLFRQGLRATLMADGDLDVVAEAEEGVGGAGLLA